MNIFLNKIRQDFDEWISLKPIKPNTIKAYENEVYRFIKWVDQEGFKNYKELRNLDFKFFLEWVVESQANRLKTEIKYEYNAKSIEQTRRIVYSFLKWLSTKGKVVHGDRWIVRPYQFSMDKNAEIKRKLSNKMSVDELKRSTSMLSISQEDKKSFGKIRNKLMANIAFWGCATTSELKALKVTDVLVRKSYIKVTIGLNKARQVFMPSKLNKPFEKYMELRRERLRNKCEYLFTNENSIEMMNNWTIRRCVEQIIEKKLEIKITPQKLRKTFIEYSKYRKIKADELACQCGNQSLVIHSGGKQISIKQLNDLEK